MSFFILIVLGLIVGLLSAFFGIGGGAITVPALFSFFPGLSSQVVVASSLGIIFFNSILNLRSFKKRGIRPHPKIFWLLGGLSFAGGLLGSSMALYLPGSVLKKIFAAVLLLTALRMLLPVKNTESENWSPPWQLKGRWTLTGLIAGTLSGLTGLGGGVVLIPLFLNFFSMPLRLVSVYSNGAMIFTALAGILRYILAPRAELQGLELFQRFQLGQLNGLIVAMVFLGSLATSALGARLTQQVPNGWKKGLYVVLMLVLATKILL